MNIINTINHIEHQRHSDIHERLFNDYKIKEITMSNLTKRYDDIESEKHPFIPKINKQNLNYSNRNTANISIKKNNKALCLNDIVPVSKETAYPINSTQPSQYNNYIIQSYKNNRRDNLIPHSCCNINRYSIINMGNICNNVNQNQTSCLSKKDKTLYLSHQPQTSKQAQRKVIINDLINGYNNSNNNTSSNANNVNHYYNINNSKTKVTSSSISLSLLTTQNKSKRHNNNSTNSTLFLNSTLPTPTTRLTKNNYVQALHNNKYRGYMNKIQNSLDEKTFLDKRTPIMHSNMYNTITQNNISTLFNNGKHNLFTEQPSSQGLFHKKSQSNGKTQIYANKSSINKYKQNAPICSRSVNGLGIDEKKTYYHSQSNYTTNFDVDKYSKIEKRNKQKNYQNNKDCNYNVSKRTVTNNNNLTSKELCFLNGKNNFSNGNDSYKHNQVSLANIKQQQYLNCKHIVFPLEKKKTEYRKHDLHLHDTTKSVDKLKVPKNKISEKMQCNGNYFRQNAEKNITNKNDITLQSFSDSKMYEIANHYITTDESLDKYQVMSSTAKRKGGFYN